MSTNLDKIREMLAAEDSALRAQAREMVLALADPEIDAWVTQGMTTHIESPTSVWYWKTEGCQCLSHDDFTVHEAMIVLGRCQSEAAKELRSALLEVHLELGWGSHDELPLLDISGVAGLSDLRRLRVVAVDLSWEWKRTPAAYYRRIAGAEALTKLESLEHLQLLSVSDIDLRLLVGLPNLKTLELVATRVQDLAPLADLGIERLIIHYSEMEVLPALPPTLRILELNQMSALADISSIASLPALEELTIVGVDAPAAEHPLPLSSIQPLAGAIAAGSLLRSVRIAAPKLTAIEALHDATALREVDLSTCSSLTSISPLGGRTLDNIVLVGCQSLESLEGFSSQYLGESLLLEGCAHIQDLAPLIQAPNLRLIDVRHGNALTDTGGAAEFPELRVIALHGTQITPNTLDVGLENVVTWAHTPQFKPLLARTR